ncbi:MAG: Hsp20/alpha crystallin family protein [Caldisericia bacterium]
MAIERYDRFADPREFASEIRKSIFNGLFHSGDDYWRPFFDVTETEDEYRMKVSIPGVFKDDVEIEIRDDVVTISGERKETKKEEKEEYHIREIVSGRFSRSLKLPAPIDPDGVVAKFKDGLLCVTLPKSERTKPRKIQIED